MSDFFSTLASHARTDERMVRQGVRILLATLQQHFPADVLTKVSAAIPESWTLLAGASPAGAISSETGDLAGIVGNLLGENSAAASLVSKFADAGFFPDLVKKFISAALDLLRDNLPPDIMNIVSSAVMPGSSGPLGNLKKLF